MSYSISLLIRGYPPFLDCPGVGDSQGELFLCIPLVLDFSPSFYNSRTWPSSPSSFSLHATAVSTVTSETTRNQEIRIKTSLPKYIISTHNHPTNHSTARAYCSLITLSALHHPILLAVPNPHLCRLDLPFFHYRRCWSSRCDLVLSSR